MYREEAVLSGRGEEEEQQEDTHMRPEQLGSLAEVSGVMKTGDSVETEECLGTVQLMRAGDIVETGDYLNERVNFDMESSKTKENVKESDKEDTDIVKRQGSQHTQCTELERAGGMVMQPTRTVRKL